MWQPATPEVVDEIVAPVISVSDGDTLQILVGKKPVKVRLEGIDAPEISQSFGSRSKQALSHMVFGKTIYVRKTGEDRYGRTLGIVMVDGVDCNAKMVEDGWAWHFRKYSDDIRLARLESEARSANRGLWSQNDPMPPWEYRARQKSPERPGTSSSDEFWLNTSTGTRHNDRCDLFKKTKRADFVARTKANLAAIAVENR